MIQRFAGLLLLLPFVAGCCCCWGTGGGVPGDAFDEDGTITFDGIEIEGVDADSATADGPTVDGAVDADGTGDGTEPEVFDDAGFDNSATDSTDPANP